MSFSTKTRDNKDLIVSMDIGTSRIVVLVAEITPEGVYSLIGMGEAASRGLKKGVVVSIDDTVSAMQRALEDAELMANCKITQVYTGISGSHVRALNSHGMVPIRDREISQADVEQVLATARAVAISNDQQVLHVLPQEYIIDGQDGVREPQGMSGVRLEVRVHIITGAVSAVQNIVKCVRRCGLEVQDLILQPLASSHALLNDDEKDLGVAMIDIGAGTSDITVFTRGAIKHTAVLPIAGDQITNDIAVALRTPARDAEDLKILHGVAHRQLADPREMIEVPGIGERSPRILSKQLLAEVIEPRMEELYKLIQAEIRRSGLAEQISSGLVITGGTSKMHGMVELAEEIFHLPVRVGVPNYSGGLSERVRNPRYASAIGLLNYSMQSHGFAPTGKLPLTHMTQLLDRMKTWFTNTF